MGRQREYASDADRQAAYRARRAAAIAALKRELKLAQVRIAELEKAGAAKPQRTRRRKAPARRASGNGR
jgi:hypothetical protein